MISSIDEAKDAWLTFLPHGWFTVSVAIGLFLIVSGYLQFGPPALLKARVPTMRLPESGRYDAVAFEAYVKATTPSPYRLQLLFDIPFLIVLGLGLAIVLDGTFGWSLAQPNALWWLVLVPLAAAAADLIEDFLLLAAMRGAESAKWVPSPGIMRAALVATGAKFFLNAASLLLILVGCIALTLVGPQAWRPTSFAPLVLGSLLVVGLHLAVSLRIRASLASFFARSVLLGAVVLLSPWYLSLVGRSTDDIGHALGVDLSQSLIREGLRFGLPPVGAIILVLVLCLLIPRARKRLKDPEFATLSWPAVFARVGMILVTTAAFEELLFRGLLFAAWGGEDRPGVAIAATSVTFGLWHIGPAIRRRSRQLGPTHVEAPTQSRTDSILAVVLATVFFTGLAGVGFGLLRLWSHGVLAPLIVHFGANSAGVVFSKLSQRRAAIALATRTQPEGGAEHVDHATPAR